MITVAYVCIAPRKDIGTSRYLRTDACHRRRVPSGTLIGVNAKQADSRAIAALSITDPPSELGNIFEKAHVVDLPFAARPLAEEAEQGQPLGYFWFPFMPQFGRQLTDVVRNAVQ